MIGIKGVGMTSLALVYHRMGHVVVGSDVSHSFITDAVLAKYGITVHNGFAASHISADIDEFVVSGAHSNANNVEYSALIKKGIVAKSHAQALGDVMRESKQRISVCGSHGKTTTSAMLATIFNSTSMQGAHHVGVPTFSGLDGGAYNGADYFIAEADEYANNPHVDNTPRFSFQEPDYLLCTNIDYDHPDIYTSLSHVQKTFSSFMQTTIKRGGTVIYCVDDHNSSSSIQNLAQEQVFSYGLSQTADLIISDVVDNESITSFTASFRGEVLGSFTLQVAGIHNIRNAAGAILVSHICNLSIIDIQKGLSQFAGSARRFQLIASHNHHYLYDDYAHHPKEIEAVINAARHRHPDYKIVVIFQPHTFSRTNAYAADFAKALALADKMYVLEVFSSEREKTGAEVSKELQPLFTIDKVLEQLQKNKEDKTVIITMGAGDIYTYHNRISAIL